MTKVIATIVTTFSLLAPSLAATSSTQMTVSVQIISSASTTAAASNAAVAPQITTDGAVQTITY